MRANWHIRIYCPQCKEIRTTELWGNLKTRAALKAGTTIKGEVIINILTVETSMEDGKVQILCRICGHEHRENCSLDEAREFLKEEFLKAEKAHARGRIARTETGSIKP